MFLSKLNIFGRIKKLEIDVLGLQTGLDDVRDKLAVAEEQIENLTENLKSLERINLYGRGPEPVVIVENIEDHEDKFNILPLSMHFKVIMRLYIDGEEYTIHNVQEIIPTCIRSIIKSSITVEGDIAIVTIQQYQEVEDIFHIEYDKGIYVHHIRKIEKEEENV